MFFSTFCGFKSQLLLLYSRLATRVIQNLVNQQLFQHCTYFSTPLTLLRPPYFFLQDGLTCLHLSKFCDHKVDCPDNSDEGHQCKQRPSCQKMNCSHSCAITWKGPKCHCPQGWVPDDHDPKTCIDLDECETVRPIFQQQYYK